MSLQPSRRDRYVVKADLEPHTHRERQWHPGTERPDQKPDADEVEA